MLIQLKVHESYKCFGKSEKKDEKQKKYLIIIIFI